MNRADLVWARVYSECFMDDVRRRKAQGATVAKLENESAAMRAFAETMADLAVEEMEGDDE